MSKLICQQIGCILTLSGKLLGHKSLKTVSVFYLDFLLFVNIFYTTTFSDYMQIGLEVADI